MGFHPEKKQPNFAQLKTTLAQAKETDNALYQTIQLLIERLTKFQGMTVEEFGDIDNSFNNVNTIINIKADKERTYITFTNESLNLPHSRRLIAGNGIILDSTVANELTISVDSSVLEIADNVPMATGAEPLEYMSDGAGHPLLVGFTGP